MAEASGAVWSKLERAGRGREGKGGKGVRFAFAVWVSTFQEAREAEEFGRACALRVAGGRLRGIGWPE